MLSKDTKARLKSALTRKSLADEFEARALSPAPCSAKLKAAVRAMICHKKAADEIIAALETVGNQTLSGRSTRDLASPNAARRLRDAMCRKAAADEIDALI